MRRRIPYQSGGYVSGQDTQPDALEEQGKKPPLEIMGAQLPDPKMKSGIMGRITPEPEKLTPQGYQKEMAARKRLTKGARGGGGKMLRRPDSMGHSGQPQQGGVEEGLGSQWLGELWQGMQPVPTGMGGGIGSIQGFQEGGSVHSAPQLTDAGRAQEIQNDLVERFKRGDIDATGWLDLSTYYNDMFTGTDTEFTFGEMRERSLPRWGGAEHLPAGSPFVDRFANDDREVVNETSQLGESFGMYDEPADAFEVFGSTGSESIGSGEGWQPYSSASEPTSYAGSSGSMITPWNPGQYRQGFQGGGGVGPALSPEIMQKYQAVMQQLRSGGVNQVDPRLQDQAANLASRGRYGDSMMMHVNPAEVEAMAQQGLVTINPDTGQPEAFIQMIIPAIMAGISAIGTIGSALATGVGAVGGAIGSGIAGLGGMLGLGGTAATVAPAAAAAVPAAAAAIPAAVSGPAIGLGTGLASTTAIPTGGGLAGLGGITWGGGAGGMGLATGLPAATGIPSGAAAGSSMIPAFNSAGVMANVGGMSPNYMPALAETGSILESGGSLAAHGTSQLAPSATPLVAPTTPTGVYGSSTAGIGESLPALDLAAPSIGEVPLELAAMNPLGEGAPAALTAGDAMKAAQLMGSGIEALQANKGGARPKKKGMPDRPNKTLARLLAKSSRDDPGLRVNTPGSSYRPGTSSEFRYFG